MPGQGIGAMFSRSSFFPDAGGFYNKTGQTLYLGDVFEADWLQTTTLTTAQVASGPAALDYDTTIAVLATSNGFSMGSPYGVCLDPGPVPPNTNFKGGLDGFAQIQINPLLGQSITWNGSPTGGSLIFSITNNGTLSYGTSTFSATPLTNAANIQAAIGGAIANGQTGVGTNSLITIPTGTYGVNLYFNGAVSNPSALAITSLSTSLTGGTTPTGTTGLNTSYIGLGTQLAPVPGQTYAAAAFNNLYQDIYIVPGTALVTFTLTLILPNGLSYTTPNITWSSTGGTMASNIAAGLNTIVGGIPGYGLLTGSLGFTCVYVAPASLGTTTQFRVTIPPPLSGAQITVQAANYVNSTLSQISVNTPFLANSGPLVSGGGPVIARAYDTMGSPTISGGFITAGAVSTSTGNPGVTQNAAPAIAPSATSGTNPLSYSAPQFTINAYLTGMPARGNTGIY